MNAATADNTGEGFICYLCATNLKKNPLLAACSPHQILQRNTFGRTIGESALQPQAFANDGIFDTGPFALKLFSGCGLVATIIRPYSGRKLPAQICANARKNRWSGVKPSDRKSVV